MAKNTKKATNVVALPVSNDRIIEVSGDVLPHKFSKDAKPDVVAKARVDYRFKLDWTGVDMATILRMASQTVVIKLQGNARNAFLAKDNKDKAGKTIKSFASIVAEYMSGTVNVQDKIVSKLRTTSQADRVEKLGNTIDKMSPEAKAKLLALLTKK